MRARTCRMALAIVLSLPLAVLASGEEKAPGAQNGLATQGGTAAPPKADDTATRIALNPIAFQIPNRGAAKTRIGGATRAAGADSLPRIEALVPEEPGLTLAEHPVLYWYLAAPTDVPIEFVLLRLDPVTTLVEKRVSSPSRAGVQRIDLAEYGVTLEPGVSYQWLVKLVPNSDDRSYDRVVGGGIERVAPSSDLSGKLAASDTSQPHVLAEAGIWYDAVDVLSRGIQSEPDNQSLWNQRAALFQQVGLPAFPLEGDAAPGLTPR